MTPFAAHLEASINPNNQTTGCKFEFGTTKTYGSEAPCEPESLEGFGEQPVGATVALTPATTYHFHVVVENASSEKTEGTDEELETLTAEKPAVTAESSSTVTATDGTLEATVNPNFQETTDTFEYATSEAALGTPSATTLPGTTLPAVSESLAAGPVDLATALTPGTTYFYRVVATNASGATQGAIEHFTTVAAPVLGAVELPTALTSSSASLHGTVNPDGSQITSCQFEYRTATEPEGNYGYVVPCATSPGSGSAPVAVSADVTGLVSGDAYHYRLVATNANGTTDGSDATFTTTPQPFAAIGAPPIYSSSRGLPDGRVYEQVSPTNKHGNQVARYGQGISTPVGFAAADGEAVLYLSAGALAPESSSGNGNMPFVSHRTSAGWVTRSVTPIGAPGPSGNPEENNSFFPSQVEQLAVSSDLSRTAFSTLSAAAVGPPDAKGLPDNFYLQGPDPFVEPEWPSRSNPTGGGHVDVVGGSPDLSTLYFESSGLLGPSASGLYEYRNGVLSDAGTLPGEEVSPTGAAPAISGGGPSERGGGHVVSADGTRAFFVRQDSAGILELYVHITETDGSQRSLLVSQSAMPGLSGQPAPAGVLATPTSDWYAGSGGRFGSNVGPPTYVYASPDGSHAFFQSSDRLTLSAPQGAAAKTYLFNLDTGALEYLPRVTGPIVTSSADGSSAVFESTAVSPAVLSRWSVGAAGGAVVPITALPEPQFSECAPPGPPSGLVCVGPAHTASDGSVVFTTTSPIAGFNDGGTYDQEGRFRAIMQVFRYDSASDMLTCVSCPPHGVTPTGTASMSNANQNLNELGGTGGGNEIQTPDDTRGISTDGKRVFFDSPDSLVPQDRNGVRDVYEWDDGTVFLLSSGNSPTDSFLIDTSESGDDVFIATSEGLSSGDTDGSRDAYDVRIPRPGDIQPPLAVPCQGDVCQGPPSLPQLLGTPSSESFSGLGNLTPQPAPTALPKPAPITRAAKLKAALRACRRQHPKAIRVRCEARARKRYHAPARPKSLRRSK